MNRAKAFLFLARCLEPDDHPSQRRDQLAEEIASGRVCWERVVEVASEHWMTLALYRELDQKRLLDLLPGDLLKYFSSIHEWNDKRNRGILEHAGELTSLLNQIGVEPLLLKGVGHLASGLYSDPAARFMSDIDILVPSDRGLECWHFLVSVGYRTSPDRASTRVECMPDREWPALWREGRVGELEMHRRVEWKHMLGSPTLYVDAEPIVLCGAKACILHPTNRMIFTIAHAYIHHQVPFGSGVPLRDLYDAMLLRRQLNRRVDWQQVTDTFARAGQMPALRTSCMMSCHLLAQKVPYAISRPPWNWISWQISLLSIQYPRSAQVYRLLLINAGLLRGAFSRTTEGKQLRREFSTPSVLLRKLRYAARLWVGKTQPQETQR